MDKVIIFDWGGIVESHENNLKDLKDGIVRTIRRYNKVLTDEEILQRWSYLTPSGVPLSATNDKKEIREWVRHIQKNMNINVPYEEFKKAYEEEMSSVKYYQEVVDYVHSLKSKCKIAILSNLMFFDKKRINAQYDLSKFDYVYLSFELEMKKPDKKIYKYVLNDLKINPDKILFIDDDTNNILVAKECGLNTCKAFGYELDKIKRAVNEFLSKSQYE